MPAAQVDELLWGVVLPDDPLPVRAAAAEKTGERTLRMILLKASTHQVKRMVAATGNPVQRLHRSAYRALTVPADRAAGEWRWSSGPESVLDRG